MNRFLVAATALVAVVTVAQAQQADPRALEACQSSSSSFTKLADCLPQADIAIRSIDVYSDIFPPEAAPLRERCIELNAGNIAGALTCITDALKKAASLKSQLPDGAQLNDPVFTAVADQGLIDKFNESVATERQRYPDRRFGGVVTFHAYR